MLVPVRVVSAGCLRGNWRKANTRVFATVYLGKVRNSVVPKVSLFQKYHMNLNFKGKPPSGSF